MSDQAAAAQVPEERPRGTTLPTAGPGLVDRLRIEVDITHELVTAVQDKLKPVSRGFDMESNPEMAPTSEVDRLISSLAHANRRLRHELDQLEL